MPHPRPTGPTSALSARLRSETAEVHKEAEQRPFMRAFFAGTLPRHAYVEWLSRQWHLYRALESGLAAFPQGSPEADVVPTALHRTARIADDLEHLTDGAWSDRAAPSAATERYVARIESTNDVPAGLLAHAWLRYMGNVGGRDVLRRITASSLGVDPSMSVQGLSFTDFSGVGEVRPFFAKFHAALDGLDLDDETVERAVAEAAAGFRHNIAVTDELADQCGIT